MLGNKDSCIDVKSVRHKDLSIQHIYAEDLNDMAFEANKKINQYFQQVSNETKLLPEDSSDSSIQNMSTLRYFSYVEEIIRNNSVLIGFSYPECNKDFTFAFNTKEKVYKPIIGHLMSFN